MREKEMTRHEIEKKLVEMAEEMLDFYRENVPNGGVLTVVNFNNKKFTIFNEASFDDKSTDVVYVIKDKDVYSPEHGALAGKTIRTEEGEWKA